MKSTANKKDSSSTTHASNNYLNDDLSGNFSFQSYEQSPHFTPYVIQAKMSSGQFDDKYEYEEEADAMADDVIQQKSADITTPEVNENNITDTLQLKSIAPEEDLDELEEQPIQKKDNPTPTNTSSNTTSSPSQLSTDVRGKMEGAFQTDFSNVNIHKNSSKAKDMGAYAFAQGNDIHFAPGQYNPATPKGQELIGHELTHVVQQRSGRVKPTTQAKGLPVNNDTELEREADDMGAKAAKGEALNLNTKIKEEEPTAIQGKGLIQMKADAGAGGGGGAAKGGAGGDGAATSGGEGAISLAASQGVIKNLAAQPPTGFIQGIKTAPTTMNAALASENAGLKASFPKIEQPTGLENRPSKASQKGKGHPMGMTPGTAGTPHPNTPGGTGMGTGGGHPTATTSGNANYRPHPNTPGGTGMGTGGGHPTSTKTSGTTKPSTPGKSFGKTIKKGGGAPMPSKSSGSRSLSAKETVTIGDETVNLDVGNEPELDLSGEANPQKLQTAKNADSAKVTSKHSTADRETTKDFGENDIYPEYPELEQMTPQVEAGIAPVIEIPEMGELPPADLQITTAFNIEAKVKMDEQVGVEMAKNDAEVAKMQAGSQQEWTKYNTELEAETQRVSTEQKAAQENAKAEVETQRQNWKTENQAVKDRFETESTAKKAEADAKIDAKVADTDAKVSQTFNTAETQVAAEVAKAEQNAHDKEQESESEGFLDWLGDKISSALDWLKEQFDKIVNFLKKAVKAIIDEAKRIANDVINLARDIIVGVIQGFGAALKILVDIAFAAFPEIRDRIKGAIDTVVNAAVQLVNQLAEGLKAFVNLLLDALGFALNFILSAYQAFVHLLLGDWKFFAEFLLGMLQGIFWLVQAASQMHQYLFWGELMAALLGTNPNDPLPGIERLDKPQTDGQSTDNTDGIDPNMALLQKGELDESDIEIDQILGEDALSEELLTELGAMGEGTYEYPGDSNPLSIQEFLGEPAGGDEENIGEEATPTPDFANMSDDAKLAYYLQQMRDNMSTADASPEAAGQPVHVEVADQIPDIAKVGPLTVGQRTKFILSQMKIGLEMYWNENKGWIIPAVIAAVVGVIALIVFSGGTALAAILPILMQSLTVIFGVILVAQIAPHIRDYFTKSYNGDVAGGAQSLAKAFAVGLVELIFTMVFKGIGKMLKGVMRTGLAALKGLRYLAKGGAKLVRRIGNAILQGGKVLFKNVSKGVTRGARRVKDLAGRITKYFRAKGFRIKIQGKWALFQININPWKTILKAKIDNGEFLPSKPKGVNRNQWKKFMRDEYGRMGTDEFTEGLAREVGSVDKSIIKNIVKGGRLDRFNIVRALKNSPDPQRTLKHLKMLDELSMNNTTGVNQVVGDLAAGGNKFDGAHYMLDYVKARGIKPQGFEVIDDLGIRRYDLKAANKLYEFKSIKNFSTGQWKQMKVDINGIISGDTIWVFNGDKISGAARNLLIQKIIDYAEKSIKSKVIRDAFIDAIPEQIIFYP